MSRSDTLHYSVHFRPVGQGLFAHGHVIAQEANGPAKPFEWIHDCGSQGYASHLLPQIASYEMLNRTGLDLLILSHFDRDHVIGVERLVRRLKPAVIVIPYASLYQRLIQMAALAPAETDLAEAFLFPARFLRTNAPDARIVFILPGGPGPGDEIVENNLNEPWPPETPKQPSADADPNAPGVDPDTKDFRIFRVPGNRPYVVQGGWEFCFYNEPRPEMMPALAPLLDQAYRKFSGSPRTPADYVTLVAELRNAFLVVRGPGSERFDANEISLVTWSGPVRRDPNKVNRLAVPIIYPVAAVLRSPDPWLWWPSFLTADGNCGTLFTGDLTLEDRNLAEITSHFGISRMNFVAHFQVPHHGARHSYLITSASNFRPDEAYISSAQYHAGYDHPNAGVVAALRASGPILVNELQGAKTFGWVRS